jgi:hypothetical protein
MAILGDPYPPAPPSPRAHSETWRANPNAFGRAFTILALLAVPMTVLMAPWSEGTLATRLGEGTGRTFLPTIVVALVARHSDRVWRWWKYLVAILVPTLLLAALVTVQDWTREQASATPRAVVVVPAEVLGLHRIDGPVMAQRLAQGREQFAKEVGGNDKLVGAAYGAPGGDANGVEVVLIGVNTERGGDFDREIRRSPERALVDMLTGAEVKSIREFDPGPAEGALSCGTLSAAGDVQFTMCGWVASGRAGMVVFVKKLALARAAAQTRSVRAAAERPDAG